MSRTLADLIARNAQAAYRMPNTHNQPPFFLGIGQLSKILG